MDATVIENELKRILRHVLKAVARFCILSVFIADAVHLYFNWRLERFVLNRNWHCGSKCASFFIWFMVLTQLTPSLMLLCRGKPYFACFMLWLVTHLKILSNPAFWSLELYVDFCAIISAVLLATPHMRNQNIVAFLLMAYLASKPLHLWFWSTLHHSLVKFLIAFVFVGYRARTSVLLLITLYGLHCFNAYDWWNVPYTKMEERSLMLFQFWKEISVMGGLMMSALCDFRVVFVRRQ